MAEPRRRASARIEFTAAGAAGPRQMLVPLCYALALAAAFGAPVRVAGPVMASLAVATRGEDLLGQFPGDDAPRPGEPREPGVPRFAPRNLTFTDGLAAWEPEGFAALAQSVLVHEYVGRTVTFRAEGVMNQAGLHLLGGMPTGPVSLPNSVTVPLAGSADWTALEVSARVAEHGGMVQFGIFLRGPGPGRVALRNPRLSFTPAAGA
jgi:hypothetical protein